ncbi:hypothetical protein [Streptomyces sp. Ru62]|uniref:hypothetical protein n=1 Tax=Streptomyces sp. Ru62 TaxID=2080745 RepID=UPI0015E40E53|nr:hypothetical protein [Streptomyces sp. Ru62]
MARTLDAEDAPGPDLTSMPAALPEPEVPAPRVVGVDEYATPRGRVYGGAVLVDVEIRRRWICCPTERRPAWPHGWRSDPGSRSSAGTAPFFAEGATAGAPQATQVADRRHLWHNLGEGR